MRDKNAETHADKWTVMKSDSGMCKLPLPVPVHFIFIKTKKKKNSYNALEDLKKEGEIICLFIPDFDS